MKVSKILIDRDGVQDQILVQIHFNNDAFVLGEEKGERNSGSESTKVELVNNAEDCYQMIGKAFEREGEDHEISCYEPSMISQAFEGHVRVTPSLTVSNRSDVHLYAPSMISKAFGEHDTARYAVSPYAPSMISEAFENQGYATPSLASSDCDDTDDDNSLDYEPQFEALLMPSWYNPQDYAESERYTLRKDSQFKAFLGPGEIYSSRDYPEYEEDSGSEKHDDYYYNHDSDYARQYDEEKLSTQEPFKESILAPVAFFDPSSLITLTIGLGHTYQEFKIHSEIILQSPYVRAQLATDPHTSSNTIHLGDFIRPGAVQYLIQALYNQTLELCSLDLPSIYQNRDLESSRAQPTISNTQTSTSEDLKDLIQTHTLSSSSLLLLPPRIQNTILLLIDSLLLGLGFSDNTITMTIPLALEIVNFVYENTTEEGVLRRYMLGVWTRWIAEGWVRVRDLPGGYEALSGGFRSSLNRELVRVRGALRGALMKGEGMVKGDGEGDWEGSRGLEEFLSGGE